MENTDNLSSSGRVTRSLRKRLTSIDSEASSSRPTTPLPAKLSSITELTYSPSRPVRMSRRNSTSSQATPSKTPIKGRAAGLRAEGASNPVINSPKRSTRRNSFSSMEDEQANGASATTGPSKFDTLPEEDADEESATSSQLTSLQEQSSKPTRGRPSLGKLKPGPKSRTRMHLQSDMVDSDVEIINLEDEEFEKEEEKKEHYKIHKTQSELIQKEKRKSVGKNNIMETLNLVNDALLIVEDKVMKKEVKAKQIEKKGGSPMKTNDKNTDEQQQTKSALCSTANQIIITKVETLQSIPPDKIGKNMKGDSFENSPEKKNSSKSVAFSDSEYDNSMKATYPRTPGRTKTKSYIEIDSSNGTIQDNSFQSDNVSLENSNHAEKQTDEQNGEKTKKVDAFMESVGFFDASNIVGETEIAMEVDIENSLLISNETPHRSKLLMKQLQSSTPVVEPTKGNLESKHTMSEKECKGVNETNGTSNVDHNELDTSLEKSLRSGKRYGSISPSPSVTKSPSTKTCYDMESPKIASTIPSANNLSKELESLKPTQLSPNSSEQVKGMNSPKPLSNKPSMAKVGMSSSKPSLNTPSKEVGISSPKMLPKNLLKEDVMTTPNQSKEVGVRSPKPITRNLSKELGMTTPNPSPENVSKTKVNMVTCKPSPKNALKEEVGMTTPKLSSKKEVDPKTQKLSHINSTQELNLAENVVNISKEENNIKCEEKNAIKSPSKAENDSILNASKTVALINGNAVAKSTGEKNCFTMSFSKSWSQGVSGTVNNSTKIDTIVAVTETIITEVHSELEDKNCSMKKSLYMESNDEINSVGGNVDDIDNEDEEEEQCEKNDLVDDEAEEADENYCSGDSMSEDERREIEDNEIPINDAESIGSQDTEEDEYDEEEAEKDSFIASDEEYQLEYSDDNEGIEDNKAGKSKENSYKRLILQSSSDESENDERTQESKTNEIDNDRNASSDDNDTTAASIHNLESVEMIDENLCKENRKSLNISEANTDENEELNEQKKNKRRSSSKVLANLAEDDESLTKSKKENFDLNESKKSKRRSSIKIPHDEIEHDESVNESTNENIDLNMSKKSKRRNSVKQPAELVEADDESLKKFTNQNVDLNESKKSKRRSSIKPSVDEIYHDESLNKFTNVNVELTDLENNKRKSSIKNPVEQDESLNNINLNESKKSKRRSSRKASVNEIEYDESLGKSTNENVDMNESKKSKRRSSIKAAADEVENDESWSKHTSGNVDLNESKKSKLRCLIKPLVDKIEHDENLNNFTNVNVEITNLRKNKRKSSMRTPVEDVEQDESLNNVDLNESDESFGKSTNKNVDLNESKKSKLRISIKPSVDEIEYDKSLNNADLNESKKDKRRSSIKLSVEENEHVEIESFIKSTTQNVEHAHNNSERRKSNNFVLNASMPSECALLEEIQEEGNKAGFNKITHVLEVGSKGKIQSVENFDFPATKRESVERRESRCQSINEAIVTSDSDEAEDDQGASRKPPLRKAPISQSLEMQREQEYESSSDDDEESGNEKLVGNSSKQKVNKEKKSFRQSKLYDNDSGNDSKMGKEKSLNVSKTQLKCANRKSLENQKSALELVVTTSSSSDDSENDDDENGKEAEKECVSFSRISDSNSKKSRREPLGKSLKKSLVELDDLLLGTLSSSQQINTNKKVVTASEIGSEENADHSTRNRAEIIVSKLKFNKSLNNSKKQDGEKNIFSSGSEIDNDNANQFTTNSLFQLSRAVENLDDDSSSPSVVESDKNDFDQDSTVVTQQQSSTIGPNEKSKLESLKSSGLSVSFGQIKEKKKSTAGVKVAHSSFTIGVSVTKNGESEEQSESSEHQDEVSFVKLGSSDSNNEGDVFKCRAKSGVISSRFNEYYQNSTPYGFKTSVTEVLGKRFLPDEPGKLVEEIESKLLEDANRAVLEKKTIEKNNKLTLHNKKEKFKSKHLKEQELNEIFVPLVCKEEQKHKEKVKLALEQALKASADILNKPAKKKLKHSQKIDERKIDTKRLPEEILEAVAHIEHKALENKNNEPSSRLPPANIEAFRHLQNIMKINSGDIVESPLTPPPSLKRKRSEMNKFELATGVVREEPATPKREKIKNGFRESPITPRTTGFKLRQILTAGQDTPPTYQTAAHKNRKRKRSSNELKYTLSKPTWTQSGVFMEEELPSTHSVACTGATQFIVSALHDPHKTTKRTAFSTASANALNFKNSAMFRDNIPRESSQQMLQRKERHRMHNEF